MKKTIQRELRLSADSTDSTVDSNLEIRPQAASPTLPGQCFILFFSINKTMFSNTLLPELYIKGMIITLYQVLSFCI